MTNQAQSTRTARWAASWSGFPYEPYLLTAADVHRAASIFARRGVVVLGPPALEGDLFEALVAESREQRSSAAWDLRGDGDGSIAQDTARAHLGPLGRELCAAGATRALIQAVTGDAVVPGWSATCLTYYDRPGQYLGAHRDKHDACYHAFLVYLEAAWPPDSPPGSGLALHVCEPGSDHAVMLRVQSVPNRIVLLHGSELMHFRPPLADGESVGLLAGCFSALRSAR
jgi:hypothetical protein